MRIAFLLDNAYGIGGTIRSTVNLSRALADRHTVEVVSLRRTVRDTALTFDPRVRMTHLLELRRSERGHDGDDPRFREASHRFTEGADHLQRGVATHLGDLRVEEYLRETDADVVIATRPKINDYLAAYGSDRYLRIGQEHLTHSMHSEHVRSHQDAAIPLLDAFVTVSYADAANYRAAIAGTGTETAEHDALITCIPNAVPAVDVEPSDGESRLIVAAGRLIKVKRYDRLLKAFAIVSQRHPDWRLRLYGRGRQQAALRARIDSLGLYDRAFLMGPHAPIEAEWAKGAIAAVSSDAESFGMTLVEAMHCGVPVVSTDCPYGPGEIISNGRDGLLSPLGPTEKDSVRAYADALTQLIENPELRYRMSQSALEKAARYSPERIAGEYEQLIEKLLEQRESRGARPERIRAGAATGTAAGAGAAGAAAETGSVGAAVEAGAAGGAGGAAGAGAGSEGAGAVAGAAPAPGTSGPATAAPAPPAHPAPPAGTGAGTAGTAGTAETAGTAGTAGTVAGTGAAAGSASEPQRPGPPATAPAPPAAPGHAADARKPSPAAPAPPRSRPVRRFALRVAGPVLRPAVRAWRRHTAANRPAAKLRRPVARTRVALDGSLVIRLLAKRLPKTSSALLLRSRRDSGAPRRIPLPPRSEAVDGWVEVRVDHAAHTLSEDRWDTYVERAADKKRKRVQSELVETARLLSMPAPVDGDGVLTPWVPYTTLDGYLAVRAWHRTGHAEVTSIELGQESCTVRAELYGRAARAAAEDGGAVVGVARSKSEPDFELPFEVAEGFVPSLSFEVPYELPAALDSGNLKGVWDLWLRTGGEDAPRVRFGRLLGDLADRKKTDLVPRVRLGETETGVWFYFSLINDLVVAMQPLPYEKPPTAAPAKSAAAEAAGQGAPSAPSASSSPSTPAP
ncbi:glycosyltransferase family 4 protein [Streptomyces sp. HNM0575]|uniref:glycosyltransferase family 4 protein n=1 Tax=Streptomyces sp. HNM0575 TaxID=2716338 RepID=UPI00145CF1C0|nr:glycosyltransferase family 4 protein [Streptomyces sp. HNM0575]NLU76718.1 glycosyltransferase family 4 protein [Streptomyces sp. HNM0575]